MTDIGTEFDIFKNLVTGNLPQDPHAFVIQPEYRGLNLVLQDKDVYKKMLEENNIVLEEGKFDKVYKAAEDYYNYVNNLSFNMNLVREGAFIRTPMSDLLGLDNVPLEKSIYVSPTARLHYDIGLQGIGKVTEYPESIMELAKQQSFYYDTEHQRKVFVDGTIGGFLEPFVVGEPLVLATWDKDGKHKDPFTGQEVEHKAGQPKTDEQGNYYFETLGGRDSASKQILPIFDMLTESGTFMDKINFMSGIEREKTVEGQTIKTLFSIGAFINPYTSRFASLLYAGKAIMDFGSEMYKTFVNNDSKTANNLQGWMRSLSTGQSLYANENFFSYEGITNMATTIIAELTSQRALATLIPAGLALTRTSALAEAAQKSGKPVSQLLDNVSELKDILGKDYYTTLQAGRVLTLLYSAGHASNSIAQQFNAAGLQKDKDLFHIMSMVALSALYASAPFDWVVRSMGLDDHAALVNKVLQEEIDDVIKRLPEASSLQKAQYAIQFKNNFFQRLGLSYDDIAYGKGLMGAGIAESFEESTEVILENGFKELFNAMQSLGLTSEKKKKLNAFDEHFLKDLLLSSIGGFAGGSLYRVLYKEHSKLPDPTLVNIITYGLQEDYKNKILSLYENGLLAPRQPAGKDIFDFAFPKDSTISYTLNDFLKDALLSTLDKTYLAIQMANATNEDLTKLQQSLKTFILDVARNPSEPINQEDMLNRLLFDNPTKNPSHLDFLRGYVHKNLLNEDYTHTFRQDVSNLLQKRFELEKMLAQKDLTDPQKKDLQKQIEEAKEELDKLLSLESSKKDYYLRQIMFSLNKPLTRALGVKNAGDFASTEEWEKYRKGKGVINITSDFLKAWRQYEQILNSQDTMNLITSFANDLKMFTDYYEDYEYLQEVIYAETTPTKDPTEKEKIIRSLKKRLEERFAKDPTRELYLFDRNAAAFTEVLEKYINQEMNADALLSLIKNSIARSFSDYDAFTFKTLLSLFGSSLFDEDFFSEKELMEETAKKEGAVVIDPDLQFETNVLFNELKNLKNDVTQHKNFNLMGLEDNIRYFLSAYWASFQDLPDEVVQKAVKTIQNIITKFDEVRKEIEKTLADIQVEPENENKKNELRDNIDKTSLPPIEEMDPTIDSILSKASQKALDETKKAVEKFINTVSKINQNNSITDKSKAIADEVNNLKKFLQSISSMLSSVNHVFNNREKLTDLQEIESPFEGLFSNAIKSFLMFKKLEKEPNLSKKYDIIKKHAHSIIQYAKIMLFLKESILSVQYDHKNPTKQLNTEGLSFNNFIEKIKDEISQITNNKTDEYEPVINILALSAVIEKLKDVSNIDELLKDEKNLGNLILRILDDVHKDKVDVNGKNISNFAHKAFLATEALRTNYLLERNNLHNESFYSFSKRIFSKVLDAAFDISNKLNSHKSIKPSIFSLKDIFEKIQHIDIEKKYQDTKTFQQEYAELKTLLNALIADPSMFMDNDGSQRKKLYDNIQRTNVKFGLLTQSLYFEPFLEEIRNKYNIVSEGKRTIKPNQISGNFKKVSSFFYKSMRDASLYLVREMETLIQFYDQNDQETIFNFLNEHTSSFKALLDLIGLGSQYVNPKNEEEQQKLLADLLNKITDPSNSNFLTTAANEALEILNLPSSEQEKQVNSKYYYSKLNTQEKLRLLRYVVLLPGFAEFLHSMKLFQKNMQSMPSFEQLMALKAIYDHLKGSSLFSTTHNHYVIYNVGDKYCIPYSFNHKSILFIDGGGGVGKTSMIIPAAIDMFKSINSSAKVKLVAPKKSQLAIMNPSKGFSGVCTKAEINEFVDGFVNLLGLSFSEDMALTAINNNATVSPIVKVDEKTLNKNKTNLENKLKELTDTIIIIDEATQLNVVQSSALAYIANNYGEKYRFKIILTGSTTQKQVTNSYSKNKNIVELEANSSPDSNEIITYTPKGNYSKGISISLVGADTKYLNFKTIPTIHRSLRNSYYIIDDFLRRFSEWWNNNKLLLLNPDDPSKVHTTNSLFSSMLSSLPNKFYLNTTDRPDFIGVFLEKDLNNKKKVIDNLVSIAATNKSNLAIITSNKGKYSSYTSHKHVILVDPTEVQGMEYDYVVVDEDLFDLKSAPISDTSMSSYERIRIIDFYTYVTRSKKGVYVLLPSNYTSSVKEALPFEKYPSPFIVVTPEIKEKLKNSSLKVLNLLKHVPTGGSGSGKNASSGGGSGKSDPSSGFDSSKSDSSIKSSKGKKSFKKSLKNEGTDVGIIPTDRIQIVLDAFEGKEFEKEIEKVQQFCTDILKLTNEVLQNKYHVEIRTEERNIENNKKTVYLINIKKIDDGSNVSFLFPITEKANDYLDDTAKSAINRLKNVLGKKNSYDVQNFEVVRVLLKEILASSTIYHQKSDDDKIKRFKEIKENSNEVAFSNTFFIAKTDNDDLGLKAGNVFCLAAPKGLLIDKDNLFPTLDPENSFDITEVKENDVERILKKIREYKEKNIHTPIIIVPVKKENNKGENLLKSLYESIAKKIFGDKWEDLENAFTAAYQKEEKIEVSIKGVTALRYLSVNLDRYIKDINSFLPKDLSNEERAKAIFVYIKLYTESPSSDITIFEKIKEKGINITKEKEKEIKETFYNQIGISFKEIIPYSFKKDVLQAFLNKIIEISNPIIEEIKKESSDGKLLRQAIFYDYYIKIIQENVEDEYKKVALIDEVKKMFYRVYEDKENIEEKVDDIIKLFDKKDPDLKDLVEVAKKKEFEKYYKEKHNKHKNQFFSTYFSVILYPYLKTLGIKDVSYDGSDLRLPPTGKIDNNTSQRLFSINKEIDEFVKEYNAFKFFVKVKISSEELNLIEEELSNFLDKEYEKTTHAIYTENTAGAYMEAKSDDEFFKSSVYRFIVKYTIPSGLLEQLLNSVEGKNVVLEDYSKNDLPDDKDGSEEMSLDSDFEGEEDGEPNEFDSQHSPSESILLGSISIDIKESGNASIYDALVISKFIFELSNKKLTVNELAKNTVANFVRTLFKWFVIDAAQDVKLNLQKPTFLVLFDWINHFYEKNNKIEGFKEAISELGVSYEELLNLSQKFNKSDLNKLFEEKKEEVQKVVSFLNNWLLGKENKELSEKASKLLKERITLIEQIKSNQYADLIKSLQDKEESVQQDISFLLLFPFFKNVANGEISNLLFFDENEHIHRRTASNLRSMPNIDDVPISIQDEFNNFIEFLVFMTPFYSYKVNSFVEEKNNYLNINKFYYELGQFIKDFPIPNSIEELKSNVGLYANKYPTVASFIYHNLIRVNYGNESIISAIYSSLFSAVNYSRVVVEKNKENDRYEVKIIQSKDTPSKLRFIDSLQNQLDEIRNSDDKDKIISSLRKISGKEKIGSEEIREFFKTVGFTGIVVDVINEIVKKGDKYTIESFKMFLEDIISYLEFNEKQLIISDTQNFLENLNNELLNELNQGPSLVVTNFEGSQVPLVQIRSAQGTLLAKINELKKDEKHKELYIVKNNVIKDLVASDGIRSPFHGKEHSDMTDAEKVRIGLEAYYFSQFSNKEPNDEVVVYYQTHGYEAKKTEILLAVSRKPDSRIFSKSFEKDDVDQEIDELIKECYNQERRFYGKILEQVVEDIKKLKDGQNDTEIDNLIARLNKFEPLKESDFPFLEKIKSKGIILYKHIHYDNAAFLNRLKILNNESEYRNYIENLLQAESKFFEENNISISVDKDIFEKTDDAFKDGKKIKMFVGNKVNPLYKRFFLEWRLLSFGERVITSGIPESYGITDSTKNLAEITKRDGTNVSSGHPFALNRAAGLDKTYKITVIKDNTKSLFSIATGEIPNAKINDGVTMINPIAFRMRTASLGNTFGQAPGAGFKTVNSSVDRNYGVKTLEKTYVSVMTPEMMRMSNKSTRGKINNKDFSFDLEESFKQQLNNIVLTKEERERIFLYFLNYYLGDLALDNKFQERIKKGEKVLDVIDELFEKNEDVKNSVMYQMFYHLNETGVVTPTIGSTILVLLQETINDDKKTLYDIYNVLGGSYALMRYEEKDSTSRHKFKFIPFIHESPFKRKIKVFKKEGEGFTTTEVERVAHPVDILYELLVVDYKMQLQELVNKKNENRREEYKIRYDQQTDVLSNCTLEEANELRESLRSLKSRLIHGFAMTSAVKTGQSNVNQKSPAEENLMVTEHQAKDLLLQLNPSKSISENEVNIATQVIGAAQFNESTHQHALKLLRLLEELVNTKINELISVSEDKKELIKDKIIAKLLANLDTNQRLPKYMIDFFKSKLDKNEIPLDPTITPLLQSVINAIFTDEAILHAVSGMQMVIIPAVQVHIISYKDKDGEEKEVVGTMEDYLYIKGNIDIDATIVETRDLKPASIEIYENNKYINILDSKKFVKGLELNGISGKTIREIYNEINSKEESVKKSLLNKLDSFIREKLNNIQRQIDYTKANNEQVFEADGLTLKIVPGEVIAPCIFYKELGIKPGTPLQKAIKEGKITNSALLEMTTMRIPLQSLASVMVNKVVGFLWEQKNSIMLNDEHQILTGGDFDVDKSNVQTYPVDEKGNLIGWHEGFKAEDKSTYEASFEEIKKYADKNKTNASKILAAAVIYEINKIASAPGNYMTASTLVSDELVKKKAEEVKKERNIVMDIGSFVDVVRAGTAASKSKSLTGSIALAIKAHATHGFSTHKIIQLLKEANEQEFKEFFEKNKDRILETSLFLENETITYENFVKRLLASILVVSKEVKGEVVRLIYNDDLSKETKSFIEGLYDKYLKASFNNMSLSTEKANENAYDILGAFLNSAIDGTKNPAASYINANELTINLWSFLIWLGYDVNYINEILNSDIVYEIVKKKLAENALAYHVIEEIEKLKKAISSEKFEETQFYKEYSNRKELINKVKKVLGNEEFIKKLDIILKLYEDTQDIVAFFSLLSINRGIKPTVIDYYRMRNSVLNIIKNIATKNGVEVSNINFEKFVENPQERAKFFIELIKKGLEEKKQSVYNPLIHFFLNNHFSRYLYAATKAYETLKNTTVTVDITEILLDYIQKENLFETRYLREHHYKTLFKIANDIIVDYYYSRTNKKIFVPVKYEKGVYVYDENNGNLELDLSNVKDRSLFINLMNNVIIPGVKEKYPNNFFLKEFVLNKTKRNSIGIQFNVFKQLSDITWLQSGSSVIRNAILANFAKELPIFHRGGESTKFIDLLAHYNSLVTSGEVNTDSIAPFLQDSEAQNEFLNFFASISNEEGRKKILEYAKSNLLPKNKTKHKVIGLYAAKHGFAPRDTKREKVIQIEEEEKSIIVGDDQLTPSLVVSLGMDDKNINVGEIKVATKKLTLPPTKKAAKPESVESGKKRQKTKKASTVEEPSFYDEDVEILLKVEERDSLEENISIKEENTIREAKKYLKEGIIDKIDNQQIKEILSSSLEHTHVIFYDDDYIDKNFAHDDELKDRMKKAKGFYYGGSIYVNREYASEIKAILLHEFLHKVFRFSSLLQKNADERTIRFREDILKIIKKFESERKDLYKSRFGHITSEEELIDEFLIRLLSEKEIINALKEIDVVKDIKTSGGNNKSLFSKLINSILSFLGFNEKTKLFEQALNVTIDYLSQFNDIRKVGHLGIGYIEAESENEHDELLKDVSFKDVEGISFLKEKIKKEEIESIDALKKEARQIAEKFFELRKIPFALTRFFGERVYRDKNPQKFYFMLHNIEPGDLILIPQYEKNNKGIYVPKKDEKGNIMSIWVPAISYYNVRKDLVFYGKTKGAPVAPADADSILAIRKRTTFNEITKEEKEEYKKKVAEFKNDEIIKEETKEGKVFHNKKNYFRLGKILDINSGDIITVELEEPVEFEGKKYNYGSYVVTRVIDSEYVEAITAKGNVIVVRRSSISNVYRKKEILVEKLSEKPGRIEAEKLNIKAKNSLKDIDAMHIKSFIPLSKERYIEYREKILANKYSKDSSEYKNAVSRLNEEYKEYLKKFSQTPPVTFGDFVLVKKKEAYYWEIVVGVQEDGKVSVYAFNNEEKRPFIKTVKSEEIVAYAKDRRANKILFEEHNKRNSESLKKRNLEPYKNPKESIIFDAENYIPYSFVRKKEQEQVFRDILVNKLKTGDVVEFIDADGGEFIRRHPVIKQENGMIHVLAKPSKKGERTEYNQFVLFPDEIIGIHFLKENHPEELNKAKRLGINFFNKKMSGRVFVTENMRKSEKMKENFVIRKINEEDLGNRYRDQNGKLKLDEKGFVMYKKYFSGENGIEHTWVSSNIKLGESDGVFRKVLAKDREYQILRNSLDVEYQIKYLYDINGNLKGSLDDHLLSLNRGDLVGYYDDKKYYRSMVWDVQKIMKKDEKKSDIAVVVYAENDKGEQFFIRVKKENIREVGYKYYNKEIGFMDEPVIESAASIEEIGEKIKYYCL